MDDDYGIRTAEKLRTTNYSVVRNVSEVRRPQWSLLPRCRQGVDARLEAVVVRCING